MSTINAILKDFTQLSIDLRNDRQADDWTFYGSYWLGYREPNHPMPVPVAVAEYDLEYIYLYNQWAELTLENRKLKGDLVS